MCSMICFRNYLCILFIALNFIISSTSISTDASFTEREQCIFPLNNGLIIDLSPLVNLDQPMYTSTNISSYIFHPCKDVALKTAKAKECQSYQLCYFKANKPTNKPIDLNYILSEQADGNFSLLAHEGEGVFRENLRKQPEIVYKHSHNSEIITTYMRLECNHMIENYVISIDKTSSDLHELTLSSKYICVNEDSHMSGGAVFFIILLVFAALYFIGGILVLKFIRGATGIEMIPNHEFWCRLPQVAKDGVAYLSTCGKRTPDSYEKI